MEAPTSISCGGSWWGHSCTLVGDTYLQCIYNLLPYDDLCRRGVFWPLTSLLFSLFLAATKQLIEHFFLSVCQSVRLSHLFHYVPIILSSRNFLELLPLAEVMSMQKGQGQRSKVKVTWDKKSPILTQIGRFRTVTPVLIYQWLTNNAQSLK